jgi:O-antigen ligase
MVRFVFVSLIASLYVAARKSADRRPVYAIIIMVTLATSAGLLARYQTWVTLGNTIISEAKSAEMPASNPNKQCGVVINNSLGVRSVLMADAIKAIPAAGFFGLGLGNYKEVACFKEMAPHNTVLQAFVELGWIAGAILLAMILAAMFRMWRRAHSNEQRFVLCCLVYVALIDMAHGSLTHSALLFLFLGYASRMVGEAHLVSGGK